jgi:Na+-transporting NADH:ubiquinone oxidoreductase subunit NqrF
MAPDETRELVYQQQQAKESVTYPDFDDLAKERADYAWHLFQALKVQGFTDDQALFLTGHLG